jgi:hypothetical protein
MFFDGRFNELEQAATKLAMTNGNDVSSTEKKVEAVDNIAGSADNNNNNNYNNTSNNYNTSNFQNNKYTGTSENAATKQSKSTTAMIKHATFMWGMWQSENELTFLLNEDDVERFPPGALVLAPQRWRVIKLCGREIDFNETGIVSKMSMLESYIPSLNISTAKTNCTLVPDELLGAALASLSRTLKCTVTNKN